MTSFFLKKQNNNKTLKKIVKFKSKLDQNLLKQKTIFSVLEKDLFIKENFDKFLFIPNKDRYQIILNEIQYQDYLDLANLILDSCEYYSWNNIWFKFKAKIYQFNNQSDKFDCSMIFRWILLLIYLNEKQKIDLEDFLRIHNKFKEDFKDLGLMPGYYFDNKWAQFDQEIFLDIDKLDNLYSKIKEYLIQLDNFFIDNFSFIIKELSFKYENLKEKIKLDNYYFDLNVLDQLIDSSNENQGYLTEFTRLNNLNLPINYIFIKYLVDNNFLCFKVDLIEKFLQKIKEELKIVDIFSLKVNIFNFLDKNRTYKKINENYVFDLYTFRSEFPYNFSTFEEDIISEFKSMISILREFIFPFRNSFI